jgi:hypothetical protein
MVCHFLGQEVTEYLGYLFQVIGGLGWNPGG